MKFREIVRFEFVYQAGRVRTWLYFGALFAFAFLLIRTAGGGEGVVNSPFSIAQDTVLTSLLWILIAPAVAGSAGARDAETRMYPLVYTAPISKADYLAGRFLAAFLLNALILLAVPLGTLAAVYLPGLEPRLVGPFRPGGYLSSYGVLALPTAFLFGAVQFSVAALKRRTILSYLGTVLFFVALGVTGAMVLNVLRMPALVQLLDPTCRATILNVMSDSLTPLEKNTVLVALDASIVANRLLWIAIASAILAFTHSWFRFRQRAQ